MKKFFTTDILMADDDEDDRLLFNAALRDVCNETKIQFAKDGSELLNVLDNRIDSLPNLIVLDINMPRRNGLECLRAIRKSAKLKMIPVAIFSTSNEMRLIEESYKAGADLYIQKPSHFDVLVKIINHMLCTRWHNRHKPAQNEFLLSV